MRADERAWGLCIASHFGNLRDVRSDGRTKMRGGALLSITLSACTSGFEPAELTEFPGTEPVVRQPREPGSDRQQPPGPEPGPVAEVASVDQVCAHWFSLFERESGQLEPGAKDAHGMLCLAVIPDLEKRTDWGETSACFMAAESQAAFDACTPIEIAAKPQPPPRTNPEEPRKVDFLDLFLTASEVPEGMMQLQKPTPEANPKDGSVFGFSMWMNGSDTATMQSFFDLRWVFNSPEEAKRFIDEAADESLSEGYPKMPSAQTIGDDCHVYGGQGKAGIVAVVYVYRVGPVVVKNFSGQGKRATSPLKPVMVIPYVQKAHDKLVEIFQ